MVSVVVVGGQWGDEGKAKVTDLLSERADCIVRYQGGANAGHTVSVRNDTYKFHLIPSGVLSQGKACIIGPGTVIEPRSLMEEIDGLEKRGLQLQGRLCVSYLAHVTMPWHVAIDKATDKVGSTGRGIGPTYSDKAKRSGLMIADILNENRCRARLEEVIPTQNQTLTQLYGLDGYDLESVLSEYVELGKRLSPYVSDTVEDLYQVREGGKNILFEGAQGTLLDITFGTYPYVTSSTPVAGGACIGAGIGPTAIDRSIGVFKSFATRVGDGPHPTELAGDSEAAAKLREEGRTWAEYGTTTGRLRRVGWFDAVLARYACRVNTFTSVAITKLDTLDQFDAISICTAYRHRGTRELVRDISYVTASVLEDYEPVLETLAGWQASTHGASEWQELPQGARDYVDAIARELSTPVAIVSTGPGREHSIVLNDLWSPQA